MRYKHYYSQTEMFASNVQFGYPCPRGGGQAVQAGLSCPPAQDLGQAVSSVNSYCTIILEYLVVLDINIIWVKLKCLHPMFSLVILVRGVGCKLSRLVYLAPRQGFGSGSVISQFLLHHNLVQGVGEWGQAVQAGLSCPLPRIWVKQYHQLILIAP